MEGLGDWPVFADGADWEMAQAALIDADLSDGLPLVPPTRRRLAAMLGETPDPAAVHGLMPPLFGEISNAAIAYNCVIAGCEVGALPVVLTAALACCDDAFNLLGLATTTGTTAVATVVHGPVTRSLAMNDGVNCLAPGNRANATLGRAISLVLRNIAGMRTGGGDMATMGQPGKYGLCFPEGADTTFAPLPVRRGLPADASAVTVIGISGTAEVLPSQRTGNWDTPEAILDPVALSMRAATVAGGGVNKPERGEQFLLLPPELAQLIAQRGWDLERVRNYLFESADPIASGSIAARADAIQVVVTGGPGTKMTVLPPWGGGTQSITMALSELR